MAHKGSASACECTYDIGAADNADNTRTVNNRHSLDTMLYKQSRQFRQCCCPLSGNDLAGHNVFGSVPFLANKLKKFGSQPLTFSASNSNHHSRRA